MYSWLHALLPHALTPYQKHARRAYRALALRALLVITPFCLFAWLHYASHYQILLLPPDWLAISRLFLPSLDRTMHFWEYMAGTLHEPALLLRAASMGEVVFFGWASFLFGALPLSLWWIFRSRSFYASRHPEPALLSPHPLLRSLLFMLALLFLIHSFTWHIAFTGLLDYTDKPFYPLIPPIALGLLSVTLWVAISHYRHISSRLMAQMEYSSAPLTIS